LCTVKYLQRKTKLGPDAQERLLRKLQGKKNNGALERSRAFIEVKRFGVPPRRHIRIHIVTIEKAINAALANEAPRSGQNDEIAGFESRKSVDASEDANTTKMRDPYAAKLRDSLYSTTYLKRKNNKSKDPRRAGGEAPPRDGERAPNCGITNQQRAPAAGAARANDDDATSNSAAPAPGGAARKINNSANQQSAAPQRSTAPTPTSAARQPADSANQQSAAPQRSTARAPGSWPDTGPSLAERCSFSQRCADHLHHALRRTNLLERRARPHGWPREFDKLLAALVRQEHAPATIEIEKEVEAVLHDHCAHLHEPFQPHLYSARSFCLRYDAAVAARARRQRQQAQAARDPDVSVKIVTRLVEELREEKLSRGRIRSTIVEVPHRIEVTRRRVLRDDGREFWELEGERDLDDPKD